MVNGGCAKKGIALATALTAMIPFAAVAGPQDQAFSVIAQFEKAFEAADVEAVVGLFAPDAILLGTMSPKIAKIRQEID